MTMIAPSSKKTRSLSWVLVALGALMAGCGSASSPRSAYAPSSAYGASTPAVADVAPVSPSPPPPPAATSMAAPHAGGAAEAAQPAPTDRPGLATHWGETRSSYIRSTTFYRADFEHPFATASLWYNDAEGARAQAAAEGYRRTERGEIGLAQSGVVVSLRDQHGRLLPGYQASGKAFAVGDAGERYTIWLENRTPARFEVVVSVDGLDVMDGQAASFQKRGYLLQPHATLEIDGFRQSEATVAAFRFGSVRGSYAARTGDDRNVGVIGVAMFHERGVPAWPWDSREIERRQQANPFPGQFAAPPP